MQKNVEEEKDGMKNEENGKANTEQDDESEDERFWKQPSYHTPEDRIAIAERFTRKQERKTRSSNKRTDLPKRVLKLFAPDGRAYNINQPKIPFKMNDEDDPDFVVLEVAVYRYDSISIPELSVIYLGAR